MIGDDDLEAVFFEESDFACWALLDDQPVRVIFGAAFALAGIGERGMATDAPQVLLPTSGVPASPYGMRLVLDDGRSFAVLEHHPDGTGVSQLVLEASA